MKTNGKYLKITDQTHAIAMYICFIIIMFCLTFFRTDIYVAQGNLTLAYRILTFMTFISTLACLISTLLNKLMTEAIILNITISACFILFIEKTIAFILNAPEGFDSFGFYISHVDITLVNLIYLSYRLSHIKQVLKSKDIYNKSKNEFDTEVRKHDD